jgi:hypothetical protein
MAKYYGNSAGVVLSKLRLTDGAETCLAAAAKQMPEGRFYDVPKVRPSKFVGLNTKRE